VAHEYETPFSLKSALKETTSGEVPATLHSYSSAENYCSTRILGTYHLIYGGTSPENRAFSHLKLLLDFMVQRFYFQTETV
jgi:hypothetical protein